MPLKWKLQEWKNPKASTVSEGTKTVPTEGAEKHCLPEGDADTAMSSGSGVGESKQQTCSMQLREVMLSPVAGTSMQWPHMHTPIQSDWIRPESMQGCSPTCTKLAHIEQSKGKVPTQEHILDV